MSRNRRQYLSFTEARAFMHAYTPTIRGGRPFKYWKSRPPNIPYDPDIFYADSGWKGWSNFLGTRRFQTHHPLLPFENARQIVRAQKFTRMADFYQWVTQVKDIPRNPEYHYAKHWLGANDWLGKIKGQRHQPAEYFSPFPPGSSWDIRFRKLQEIPGFNKLRPKSKTEKISLDGLSPQEYVRNKLWGADAQ